MEQPYSDTNAGLHYDLLLDLDPRTQFITVSGSVAYHSPNSRLERARFYLHRQLTIQSLTGRRVLGYHHEISQKQPTSFMPQAAVLDIYFDPPLARHETALIEFKYSGHVTDWPADSANILSSDWCELGLQFPWFPAQYDEGLPNLTFTLKVICPDGYQASSYGRSTFHDGAHYFNWPFPTTDIVVAAGHAIRILQLASESNRVTLASSTFGDETASQLGEELLWILERFSGWFGPTRPAEITLIESPRRLGGGYARRGIIVLNGIKEQDYLSQPESLLHDLAHKVAHTWWWQAPVDSWEDWLNESMAEYSALLVIRERFGSDIFQRFLDQKRRRTAGTPPLWEFDRLNTFTPEKHTLVERMLYDRGPLMLHKLAQQISNPRFLELCRAILWSAVTNTNHLLDLLEELEGTEIRRWLENQLQSVGDPP